MLRGDLYHAFTPELVAERRRCELACIRFNAMDDIPRRKKVEMLRE
jgi:hypothetical protein